VYKSVVIFVPNYAKTHLHASVHVKNFLEVIPPDTRYRGEGREGREGRGGRAKERRPL
jgi:hypothetical protein